MDNASAVEYLQSFLDRRLNITTTDGRIFAGQMKCTDNERNVILALTHEYRHPSAAAIRSAALSGGVDNVKLSLSSRFLGLVVVPGQHITKIEVEESSTQMDQSG
ncbi:MAG: hypothetical protein M4579_005742 [Chaenotheca gracillima]|nr:MAG: hypothetical protein M4579_005742 [Chaenotheca gracillima]